MGQYTITLTDSQEDALAALVEERAPLTAAALVQAFVAEKLLVKEQAIEAAFQRLASAGDELPAVIRSRITAGLTSEQLTRLGHLGTRTPDREGGTQRGNGPRIG